jgi:hypothetical protein
MSRRIAPAAPPALSPINQPLDDWASLDEAPFYCFSQRYIHSDKRWKEAFVQEFLKIKKSKLIAQDPEFAAASRSEWVINKKRRPFSVELQAMGVSSFIMPVGAYVCVTGSAPGTFLLTIRWGPNLHNAADWDAFPSPYQVGALEHRKVLCDLVSTWLYNFKRALKLGSAVIMARKGSVLAQFEQITWDQWQFFNLDDPIESQMTAWYDPRDHKVPLTATGPSGERLYGIYVAPGHIGAESEADRPEAMAIAIAARLSR